MTVEVVRSPTDEDWARCRALALSTVGIDSDGTPTEAWRRSMLRAGHSPIRTLMFTIRMEIPYWVSVHLVRHKVGVEHYVRSQRNDRQHEYDRNKAPQDTPVTHVMDINAQALMNLVQMRTCEQAARETQEVAWEIVHEVCKVNPEFDSVLVPKCVARGGCNEFRPCGYYDS